MLNQILTILTSGVVSAAVTALLIFFVKTWISERIKSAIQHEYDQKLEAYKAQLKAESDSVIEKLKSQLQISAAERSIKLTKVFEQQADTIAESYAKLVALLAAFQEYTAPMEYRYTPSKAERRRKFSEKLKAFLEYYEPRKIFLPNGTQSKIDAFVRLIYEKGMRFMFDIEQGLEERTGKAEESTWLKTMDFISKDSVAIMASLDADLKRILGILDEEMPLT